MVTKRTASKAELQWLPKAVNPENADNVKARVLHVMNMNHTKKKAKHMQQNRRTQRSSNP